MNTNREQIPLVSVICPSYNHEPYLRQALDSILMQQTDFPIEVLVGEDCSPDNSREILQEYERQYPDIFQMFYRNENMGATRNGHDLRMRTKGKYIITLETDDYWTDSLKLQKQVDFLETHPEYIGCVHACDVVNEHGTVIKRECSTLGGTRFTLQDFVQGPSPFQTATLMCRNIFLDGDDYSIICTAHPLVGDFTIVTMLLLRGDLFIMPDCMSVYRQIIKKGGTSFSALEAENRAESILSGMEMVVTLEAYFKGQVNYSYRKQAMMNRYLSEWLRRRPGFTMEGLRYMWNHVDLATRIRSILFLIGFPVRKLKARFQNRKQEERVNGG